MKGKPLDRIFLEHQHLRYILSKKSHEKDREAEEESGLVELF